MLANNPRTGPSVWMTLAILFAIVMRLYAAGTEDHQSPDTYQYARQAQMLRSDGLAGARQEAERFVNDPAMVTVPSIARTVFLGALTGWMKLTETSGPTSVAAFSCLLDMVAVVLLALFASEALGTAAAVPAVLLYGASPAMLSIARHGWSDSAVSVICLLNLLLALRCLRTLGEQWPTAALAATVALSFGVKETAFAQACLVLLTTALVLFRTERRAAATRLAVASSIALLAMLLWTAFFVGGMGRVVKLFGMGRDAHGTVPYALAYQTGTVLDWAHALWLTDPVVITLGIAGLVAAALHDRTQSAGKRFALVLCAGVCCIFAVLPTLGPALYNVRWEAPLFAPACLLAAFGLQQAWLRTKLPLAAAIAMLATCAALSIWRYETLVAQPDLQDLSLRMVLTGYN